LTSHFSVVADQFLTSPHTILSVTDSFASPIYCKDFYLFPLHCFLSVIAPYNFRVRVHFKHIGSLFTIVSTGAWNIRLPSCLTNQTEVTI